MHIPEKVIHNLIDIADVAEELAELTALAIGGNATLTRELSMISIMCGKALDRIDLEEDG